MISDEILAFYKSLTPPKGLSNSIETLNPYQDTEGWRCTEVFYRKYYNDHNDRYILFGINPGRMGGGLTGIPFTDPIALEESCHIKNSFHKRAELSSKFVYEMIHALGGPESFYLKFFITGISPLGYIENGKNLNYYDIKNWRHIFENIVVDWIKMQLKLNINRSVAYSIGKGQNIKFLKQLNDKHKFFDRIESLPHPRWVMQYRLKTKAIFIEEYKSKLHINT